jgi:hypothetical protein
LKHSALTSSANAGDTIVAIPPFSIADTARRIPNFSYLAPSQSDQGGTGIDKYAYLRRELARSGDRTTYDLKIPHISIDIGAST